MTPEKDYIIGFTGTGYFRTVTATSIKAAKAIFADSENIKVSGYITYRMKAHEPTDNIRLKV